MIKLKMRFIFKKIKVSSVPNYTWRFLFRIFSVTFNNWWEKYHGEPIRASVWHHIFHFLVCMADISRPIRPLPLHSDKYRKSHRDAACSWWWDSLHMNNKKSEYSLTGDMLRAMYSNCSRSLHQSFPSLLSTFAITLLMALISSWHSIKF